MRDADQLDDPDGLRRLCSAQLFDSHQFGDGRGVDGRLFITGEETGGGTAYVLDPASDALYAVAAFGKAGFESVTQLDTGTTDKVAFIIGDDRPGAPLLLYVGEKGAGDGPELLVSNGLMEGSLYVWVANKKGVVDTSDFNGTGNQMTGKWVEIEYYNPDLAGEEVYDALGYATQDKQDELAEAAGAFEFSRPEDVHTNPADGSEFVLASTGRSGIADDSDLWGTTYTMDVKFNGKGEPVMGTAKILYDGDDAGAGQFSGPDYGLRSPDNLTWADDGLIYVQEDRSVKPASLFGDESGKEASIWTLILSLENSHEWLR